MVAEFKMLARLISPPQKSFKCNYRIFMDFFSLQRFRIYSPLRYRCSRVILCYVHTIYMANISNFIRNQRFRVLIGDTLSDVHSQENGIVQGAILSVNLFLIALRSITPCIDPSVKIIGYADEWTIY
jgi:hypothetical protein